MNSLDQIWTDQEIISGKNVVRYRLNALAELECYAGLIGATGARMFQIKVDDSLPIHKNYLRKFRGVEIQVIPINSEESYYTIILLEKELTDVFTMFMEDVIDKLAQINDVQAALSIVNQRVNYWKKLFSRASGELLSPENQRGLFGEIFFLKTLLESSSAHKKALSAWRGSEKIDQDFVIDKNAVEVKTSKSNNPSVHIANEQQLDFNAWDNLFLGLVAVHETSGSESSLCSIISEIQKLLSYDFLLLKDFERKITEAGIGPEMLDSYNETSYTVTSTTFFRVKDGFPVILRGNLHSSAIYNVKYEINVAACSDFEVSEDDVIKTLL